MKRYAFSPVCPSPHQPVVSVSRDSPCMVLQSYFLNLRLCFWSTGQQHTLLSSFHWQPQWQLFCFQHQEPGWALFFSAGASAQFAKWAFWSSALLELLYFIYQFFYKQCYMKFILFLSQIINDVLPFKANCQCQSLTYKFFAFEFLKKLIFKIDSIFPSCSRSYTSANCPLRKLCVNSA